jgi:hypothetical protein
MMHLDLLLKLLGRRKKASWYDWLWAVQEPHRSGATEVLAVLRRFSLLGFVVYDPREDPGLHESLQRDWDELDRQTGQDFLVLAPVDPPSEWLTDPRAADRALMRLKRRDRQSTPKANQAKIAARPLVSRDPSRAATALRIRLAAPPSFRSFLVITRDVNSQSAWLVSTDGEVVQDQLRSIGVLATDMATESPSDEWLGQRLARLARPTHAVAARTAFPERLSSILTDICAAAAAHSSGDGITQIRVQQHLQASVDVQAKSREASTAEESLETLARYGVTLLLASDTYGSAPPASGSEMASMSVKERDRLIKACQVSNARGMRPLYDFVPGISPRAAEFLRLGDEFRAKMLLGGFRRCFPSDPTRVDFSPAVALWAKALEYEMAELLGHEVRQGLGVTLPEFFWRHQPDLRDVTIHPPVLDRTISFNRPEPRAADLQTAPWSPPTMGEIRLGWEEWRKRSGLEWPAELSELLTKCTWDRNQAAHASSATCSAEEAEVARGLIREALRTMMALGIKRWSETLLGSAIKPIT